MKTILTMQLFCIWVTLYLVAVWKTPTFNESLYLVCYYFDFLITAETHFMGGALSR